MVSSLGYEVIEIPFNRAARAGNEQAYIDQAIRAGHLAADGQFTDRASAWLEQTLGSPVLLVHSCTAALEMSAILADIGPGDEVIMPSFTFVSTANAFVVRGATPVFVDIDPTTLNLDPNRLEAALSDGTRAVVPVHYAGVGCDMDAIGSFADTHGLAVIEDAAQGLLSSIGSQPLGTLGDLGTLSFHETKNVTCGEGGALIINDSALLERAEIIREKGTDRSKFFRGLTDKYTWVDLGSSHAMSEVSAAFLLAQLESAKDMTERRLSIWNMYHAAFDEIEAEGLLTRPSPNSRSKHNAHMYQLILPEPHLRDGLIEHLKQEGIGAVFHYIPLHSAPAGMRFGRTPEFLPVTEYIAPRLVRLPLWPDMTEPHVNRIVAAVDAYLRGQHSSSRTADADSWLR